MSLGFNLLRSFAVCASLASCGSLERIDTVQNQPPSPDKNAVRLEDLDGFGKIESSSQDVTNSFISYMFMRGYCVELPVSVLTYENDEWELDCTGIRQTDSGDFLIRHLLQIEYLKRIGKFEAPKSYPDTQAFRFVG